MDIDRRQALRLAAAASGAAALGAVAKPAPARAGGTGSRIHIHGALKAAPTNADGGQVVPDRLINLDVAGSEDGDLCGTGWDVDTPQPDRLDATYCLWTARGSVEGDTVMLDGTVIDALNPDFGKKVTTRANLSTGETEWALGDFKFVGTLVVTRV